MSFSPVRELCERNQGFSLYNRKRKDHDPRDPHDPPAPLKKFPHRWIETLPSGQKRVFSWIINGLMLKVTISLESHEDEQTCHFNRGSQATLAEGDLVRVTVSN